MHDTGVNAKANVDAKPMSRAGAAEVFSWKQAGADLDGLPNGAGLNIAHEAVDRHVVAGRGGHTAIRWLAADSGPGREITYAELAANSNRFANVLAELGVVAGDVVCSMLGRIPELYAAFLGILKNRSVFCPLFTAFGPEPIKTRLELSRAKVLVTTAALYKRKVAALRSQLPHLAYVLLVDLPEAATAPEGCINAAQHLAGVSAAWQIAPTRPDDPALLHFTSGTTGAPKGALHVHQAVVVHHATGKSVLDLHPDDIYWCTADPGWVTGTSYGIIAPLTIGATMVVDAAEFDAARWYKTLQDQHVTVWYTAPTAVRMLMKAGDALVAAFDLSHLRHIVSVGEPLNPEAVLWAERVLHKPIHDTWWQTETGGIMIANTPSMIIKPGSMGRPVPGIEAAIVHLANGHVIIREEAGTEGELALRTPWPSMFRTYLNQEERYRRCFVDGFYLTGDMAKRDADGYFWFVGRADDVIKSAGHLIGPFEVESALMEHPAVAEAAVIGKPDVLLMEAVKAFVALRGGYTASEDLRKELMAHTRKRLGAAVAPREITFVADLPKTKSGKIMRRLLKARELGLPDGDLSTLEKPYNDGTEVH